MSKRNASTQALAQPLSWTDSSDEPAFVAVQTSEPSEIATSVVELEDLVELETREPVVKQKDNFLALYFKEMAGLSVLKPEQEFEAAKQIEVMEVDLWAHALGNPQTLGIVLHVLQRGLERKVPELDQLKRLVKTLHSTQDSPALQRFQKIGRQAAKKIHQQDVDRRLLIDLITEFRWVAQGGQVALGARGQKLQVNFKAKSFRDYHTKLRSMFRASQGARNEFVKANLRLVVSIARRFNHGRMPLSDLIQEGNIGLIKAVERYDFRRGYRFSTYASWWIRHSISRALADKSRTVRLPVHMLDAYHKVVRTTREFSSKLGRQPTTDEIGRSAGLTPEKVEKLQGYLLDHTLSLDRTISDDDDRRFIELIHDPDALAPTDKLSDQSVTLQVQQIFGELKSIEADVLRKRYGLEGVKEQTLKEIGATYKLSRERIRQIQEQALWKIRRALQRQEAV
jgi:RNA polymerase primary sigma factor